MRTHRRLPAIFRSLPLLLMVLVTGGVIVGFRLVRPAVRELAEYRKLDRRISIVECKDYAFFVFDKRNNRYRFEAWDKLGLKAAYSPSLDSYQARTAAVRVEDDGSITCVLDDRPFASWNGELWRKQSSRTENQR